MSEIILKIEKKIFCANYWHSKYEGVIFVRKEEDINPLFEALVEQDSYWGAYKYLIKVIPIIESEKSIKEHCNYVGKTDIYDVKSLK